ncbi:hypothetical protein BRADI_4g12814v3, partial [Brachypodium distachyon]
PRSLFPFPRPSDGAVACSRRPQASLLRHAAPSPCSALLPDPLIQGTAQPHPDSPSCVRALPPARFRGLRLFYVRCSPAFPPLPVHLRVLKEKAAYA